FVQQGELLSEELWQAIFAQITQPPVNSGPGYEPFIPQLLFQLQDDIASIPQIPELTYTPFPNGGGCIQ
ncbi:hypothetical protein FRC11_001988, partial [Ceratobasidium sp. 423]